MYQLKNEILNLKFMSAFKAAPIKSLGDDYPAFFYRDSKTFGVFIKYNGELNIFNSFSNVTLRTLYIDEDNSKVLYLSTSIEDDLSIFSSIVENFLLPENRMIIEKNPYEWCEKWSELVGNTKVKKLISDVVSELYVYNYLLSNYDNVSWGGSNKTTNDFQLPNFNVEVKSTTLKYNSLISINSKFQLKGDNLVYLYFCRLEKVPFGHNINSLVEELVKKGVSRECLESELTNLNYQKGTKERLESFEVLELRSYMVKKETFPLINVDQLNKLANVSNIVNFKLDIDLDGMEYERLK